MTEITPQLLALQLVAGIALGAIYALLAIGLSLIFGMLTVVNFAHGAFFMVGAFLGVTGSFWFSLLLVPLATAGVGLVTERFLVRPLYGRGIDYPLLLTFGLSWVLIEAMRVIFGIEGLPSSTPPVLRGSVDLGIGFFPKYRLFLIAATAVVVGALWLFLEKTPYGAIIKAGAHDSEMVRALGINLSRLRLYVFALGVALAAIAGVIMAPIWGIRPHVGVDAVVPAFLIIVLGGVGSLWGAVIAGLLVGLVVGFTGAFASEWSLMSMYILFIAVVTFRARGLFGKKSVLDA